MNKKIFTVLFLITLLAALVCVGVSAASLESVSVKTLPAKLECFVGDTPDYTGLTLTAVYDDESVETIESGFECAVDTSAPGVKTVTVTYQGKTATFEITVTPKTLTSISIKTPPTKTEYKQGEALDLTGGVLTLYYDNDTEEDIPLTDAEDVTGFTTETLGPCTLTVYYGGKSTYLMIKVVLSFEWDCTATATAVTVKTIPESVSVFAMFTDASGRPVGIKKLTANAPAAIPADAENIRLTALDGDNVPVAPKAEFARPSGGGIIDEDGGSWSPIF